ncbi:hypothetical protein FRC09_001707 [Ceratobasidium sp. 395]|nr:hypothetical protein FRC09_001707 [Ceratobasidium sp. 395]
MPAATSHQSTKNTYEYLRKYARNDDTWQPWATPDTTGLARQTLDTLRNGKEVSTLQLESVVSLTAHPRSLYILNDPALIDACILRLVKLQKQDPTYPFGHEAGYLLFRIVVLAIGIRTIGRVKRKYDIIITKLLENERKEDLSVMLMDYVTGTAMEQISQTPFSPYPFLGWSSRDRFFKEPLISEQNALALLDILWTDRGGFLKTWAESHAPSMFGIISIIWRCVEMSSTRHRWGIFCEVLWRYHVVAGTEHLGLVPLQDSARHHIEDWKHITSRVDLDDARNVMQAYTERITSTSILYPIPNLAAIGQMVAYVVPMTGLTSGTEDLFIPLIRATFEYFWSTVAGKTLHTKFSLEAEDVASTVLPAYTMLDHLHKRSPGRVHEFVTTCGELGVIEALARGFVLMKEEREFDEEAKFQYLFEGCANFGAMLALVDPAIFRVSTFAPAFPDWYKALRYMRARDSMFNTRTQKKRWYKRAELIWGKTGEYLEYDEEVQGAEVLSSGCAYTRCPDPESVKGVRFECPCNQGVVYCGHRCQKADWILNLPGSHRRSCRYRW